MKKRCLALYSGGLDSILTVKLMESIGIDVIPIHFTTPFYARETLLTEDEYRQRHLDKYGIDVKSIDFTEDLVQILDSPMYGYGKNFNPCIDCKIFMLRKCATLLDELEASFIVTGEVLGQRPMSQRRDTMNAIANKSGLKGILLRPLCAQNMPATQPEIEGIVDRSKLLGITGRGRKDQIALAEQFGIAKEDVPTPAGGCLLTEELIAKKARMTFDRFKPGLPMAADLALDTVGRKFMLDDETVLIVSRRKQENEMMARMVYEGNMFIKVLKVPGPMAIIRGNLSKENLKLAAGICLRYCKSKGTEGLVAAYGADPDRLKQVVDAPVLDDDLVASFQIDLQNS